MDLANQLHQALERLAVLEADNARLREHEARYQFMFDTMAHGILVQDTESRIIAANRAAADILGLSMEQLLGKTSYDPRWKLIDEQGVPVTPDAMPSAIALRTGQPVTNVVCGVYLPEIGRYRWIIINAVPKYDAGANPPMLTVTTVTDITERKQALEALEQSEHRLRALIEHAPFGAHEYTLQDDGHLVFAGYNQAANRILGVNCALFIGKTIEAAFPPLAQTPIPDAYRHVAATGTSYEAEQLQYAYGQIVGVYELFAFQTSPRRMAVFFRDITERRRAEDALRQERDQSQRYLDIAGVILVAINAEQRVTLINAKGSEVLGAPQSEILGCYWFQTFVPARLRDAVVHGFRQLLDGKIESVEYFENPVLRADGTERLIAWHNSVLHDATGRIIGTLSSGEDITERKAAEEAVRASEQRWRILLQTVAVGVVVHDIDTRVIESNAAAQAILGLTSAQMAGKEATDPVWRFVTEEETPLPLEAYPVNRVLTTAQALRGLVLGVIRPDRRYITWVLVNADPVYGEEGTLSEVIVVFMDITARKTAAEELRRSEQLLKESQRVARVGHYVFDIPADTWEGSEALDDIFGIDAGYPHNYQGWVDLVHPDDRALMADYFQRRVLVERQPFRKEYRIQRICDGATRWVQGLGTVEYASDGRPLTMFGTIQDITERAVVEEALKQSEDRYRTLYNAITDAAAVQLLNPDGTPGPFVEVNDVMVQRLGYTRDELLHMTPLDFTVPPSEGGTNPYPIFSALLNGKAVRFEQINVTRDGRRIHVENHSNPIRYQGRAAVFTLSRDITERKRTEAALEQERALLSTGIEILPFPIIFETASGEILRANRAAHGLYGDQEPLALDTVPKMQLLEPGTRRVVPEAQWPEQRALRGEVISSVEYVLVMSDGHETPVLAQAAPIYVHDELIGVVMALQDISNLKAADAAKDQFLMVLSHEMKTPLTSILGWAQAALRMPDQAPQALGVIVRNAQEQSRILEDLLDVSRLVTGRLALQPERCDLWELTTMSVESVMHAAEVRNLTLHSEPPSVPLPVVVDPGRLRQAINNLLTNAIKFTDPGGEIWVRACRRDNAAILEVQDTGRGIDPAELATLFRPFLQLRREESRGGLGLGLSLVKGIIDLQDGHVHAESPGLGQGSTFTITLPIDTA